MSLLALIPARGGSKGIPRKNIRPLAGKPLIAHTICAARQVSGIERVVVSTDDPEIAAVARQWGAEVPFLRPPELAADTTPGIDPVLHALEQIPEASRLLLLQPTSPLRAAADIEGILAFQAQHSCPSVVSVTASPKHPQWMVRLNPGHELTPFLPPAAADTRQQLEPAYAFNGALYLCDRTWLQNQRSFVGPGTLGYLMPPERSVDIDTSLDWLWAETLLQRAGELA
ncbi:acylneuraminate cytidylyltransferase family protein [Cyanobium sp. ATX 6E8]|uniref:acylneuraminate cytidylyltransferase family protein n=1 Tax=Cyanobium sp. ATX 6E8 TaxID=2823701 RepID=UPI0020CE7BC4|nr:acylneuraminate cytidylyltransferase family protein [Cyanobium sp. ATX 6E8]MCP9941919.1 acylneuraminate cytidylyltransferase family protein [Cyanobium sp. ATX 6E8]